MTVKDRLLKFLSYKGISQRMFERNVGLSNGYITNMKQTIMPGKVQRISLHYPDLNTGWLLTGDGDMLIDVTAKDKKSAEPTQVTATLDAEPLLQIIRDKDKRIEELACENAVLRLLLKQNNIIY